MSCPLPACYNITREFRAPIYLPEGMTLGGDGSGTEKGSEGRAGGEDWQGRAAGFRPAIASGCL